MLCFVQPVGAGLAPALILPNENFNNRKGRFQGNRKGCPYNTSLVVNFIHQKNGPFIFHGMSQVSEETKASS
jgi:hypothetical protein